MPRLKDRNRQIPNGLKFALPEVGYKSRDFDSFSTIVNQVSSIIKGNPGRATQYGWPQSDEAIADWVDDFNARLCQMNGWNDYTTDPGGGAPNFPSPPPQDKNLLNAAAGHIRKIWAGVKTLDEWIDSGEPAVAAETAEGRAAICTACPRNGSGDFTSWFAAPAAALIKAQIEKLEDRKLTTIYDSELGVCGVCLCPMRLKVHTPLKFIAAHMTPEVLVDLQAVKPECWIPKEIKAA